MNRKRKASNLKTVSASKLDRALKAMLKTKTTIMIHILISACKRLHHFISLVMRKC